MYRLGLYTIGGGYLPERGQGEVERRRRPVIEQVVRALVNIILDHVPHAEAQQYLDDEARKRADIVADVAEEVKFAAAPLVDGKPFT